MKRIYSNANDKNVCKRMLYIGDDGYIYCDKELTEKVDSEVLMNFAGKDLVTIFDASGVQYTPVNFNKVDDYVVVTIFDSNGDLQYLYSSEYPEQIVPEKGQLIEMNIEGTPHKYRILKNNLGGSKVFVMDMTDMDPDDDVVYDSTDPADNTYNGSDLDTYLNTTLYNTFTEDAKSAIEDSEIQQYKYTHDDSLYDVDTHSSYFDYSSKTAVGTAITRKVYALDLEDIYDYLGGEFSAKDLAMMFYNYEGPDYPPEEEYEHMSTSWLRSARTNGMLTDDAGVCYVEISTLISEEPFDLFQPYIGTSTVRGSLFPHSPIDRGIRPAFVIDLSKIDWTLVE